MVRVPVEVALEGIKNGSDCLIIFPVYERKIRDGKEICKVRLVADGSRRRETAGPTYSSTPSREEFFMMVDMIARYDWEWCHVDEDRAFLNADRIDEIPLYARLKGERDMFQILRALYGLKTSTRDHSACAAALLEKLGFIRRWMCMNIFEKTIVDSEGVSHTVVAYQFVDDYFFTGSKREMIDMVIVKFRETVKTSEPFWNPTKGLGMEFERDREKKIIMIRMSVTIKRLGDEFLTDLYREKDVEIPLPKTNFIVEQSDFDALELDGNKDAERVSIEGRMLYMKIVGAILWVSGFRWDISLVTVYLTWFTNDPRLHHVKLGERVVKYLLQTIDIPLVLGGLKVPQLRTLSDASLGTGPKMRSVVAYGTRLGKDSGFVSLKVRATQYMALSSFEGKINGYFEAFKMSARLANVGKELSYNMDPVRMIIGDNKKAIEFIRGEAEGKGLRHALRRFSYMREEFAKGAIDLQWIAGIDLVVDAMTKAVDVESFITFRKDVQGLKLLDRETEHVGVREIHSSV